jgi:FtsP/CotA-like multicopper oxidase with cupredoxin domain
MVRTAGNNNLGTECDESTEGGNKMVRHKLLAWIILALALVATVSGFDPGGALAAPVTGPGSVPDYFETPNWANSPPLRKFVDTLPGLNSANNLGQMITIAQPDTATFPGSDYYEIELVEYRERMHSDLPPLNNANKMLATAGGTKLRGYRQTNTTNPDLLTPHYLGPLIIAQKDRPVRIKFTNSLPTGAGGNLFLPTDTTVMGSGPFEINYDPVTKAPTATVAGNFTQNRATLHLHGGRTPWISDGTAHQWITPAGETTSYPKGVSVQNVPDMPVPGDGSQTFYYTNQQSARLMFYHDHAWGITRLNVYAGEAAAYLIQDPVELAMVNGGTVNGRAYAAGTIPADQIPLVIQDKTFVDPGTITATDPTWNWGSTPGTPVKGDLWWPHVYMPAQNPYNPDFSGMNAMGRWHYGPWFFPPTPVCGSSPDAVKPFCIEFGPVPNPYYDCYDGGPCTNPGQPPEMPGTPNTSWGAEAFLDTMLVNGTVYPTTTVAPQKYRLRILNASHDRFLNLQLYQADAAINANTDPASAAVCAGSCATLTEVRMVPAAAGTPGLPANWPTDGREGGVPDPALRGPAMIQIGTEGGLLPAPVLLPNHPVAWNLDPTMFNVGNVLQQADGGGTLFLGPAERADIIVDFTNFAGKTLILYNDAPTAFPALDPHYDYYTGAPDRTDIGGAPAIPPGVGPNNRTVMQIRVSGSGGTAPVDDYNPATLAALEGAFKTYNGVPGAFAQGQDPVVVGQSAYNTAYDRTFPATWPNWGLSRVSDTNLSFKDPAGIQVTGLPMLPKAIHDEMGASFDDFGRMSAKLGLEVPFVNAAIANFVLQNFVDPATEIVAPGGTQIWKITHNGVDTHPIHFHLFDVQVVNRVGWDGFIRLPDPNELGWKDTVRISPLEDTIVALRPVKPQTPFPVPNNVRPLNPAAPLGSNMGFSNIDPLTGGPLTVPTTNAMTDFGHEYTWHCHILSHEENDMMRPLILQVPTDVPPAPVLAVPATAAQKVVLAWTVTSAATNAPAGFLVERSDGGVGPFVTMATINYSTQLTYTDTTVASNGTYAYRIIAFNSAGSSQPSNSRTITTAAWLAPTVALTAPTNGTTIALPAAIGLAATATPGIGTISRVEFYDGGILLGSDTTAPYGFTWTNASAGTHSLTAKAYDSNGVSTTSAAVTVTVTQPLPVAPTAISPTGPGIPLNAPFTFSAVTGATRYRFYLENMSGVGNFIDITPEQAGCASGTGTCSFTPATQLTTDTTYGWLVSAQNAAGQGPWSSTLNFITVSSPVPTILSPTGPGIATSASFFFTAVAGATGYTIYYENLSGVGSFLNITPAQAGCASGTGACSFAPATPFTAATTYGWLVSAQSAAGQGPWSATLSFVTAPATPAAPTAIGPTGPGIATNAPFTFSAVAGATGYTIYFENLSGVGSFINVTPAQAGCASGTGTCSFTLATPFTAATTYGWLVSAQDAAVTGPWSATLNFVTQ